MEHSFSLLTTDAFWALIALVIFVIILIALKVPHFLVSKLDERSQNIAKELEDARNYKQEAQKLYLACLKKQQHAEQEAEEMLQRAQREALQITSDMREASEQYLERRKVLIDQQLQIAKDNALKEIKQKVVDLSIAKAKQILQQKLDNKHQTDLIEAEIKKINF